MARDKIKSKAALVSILNKQRPRKRIVFTNGCFDILHYGHIKYLEDAKRLGDILVVGLNADASVKKIKGKRRPIINQSDRARILSALASVDYVTVFNEDTPRSLIEALSPDVLVKGGDWKKGEIVGADFICARGGRVVTIPYIRGRSTSKIIEKIRRVG